MAMATEPATSLAFVPVSAISQNSVSMRSGSRRGTPHRSPTAATTLPTTGRSTRPSATLKDAESLIAEALALGIRTVIDVVPNHVSDQHPWFKEALSSEPGSPARERFWFHPGKGARTVTTCRRTGCRTSEAETWTRTHNADGTDGEWYLHLFAPEQPDLNWNSAEVRRGARGPAVRFSFTVAVAGVHIDSAALLGQGSPAARGTGRCRAGAHPTVNRDTCTTSTVRGEQSPTTYAGTACSIVRDLAVRRDRLAKYLRQDETRTAFNCNF